MNGLKPCLSLNEARSNIREAARLAMARLADHKPLHILPPITLEVDWRNNQTARSVALMPGVEQIGSETTRFSHEDFAEVDRALKAMLYIALSPVNAGHIQTP